MEREVTLARCRSKAVLKCAVNYRHAVNSLVELGSRAFSCEARRLTVLSSPALQQERSKKRTLEDGVDLRGDEHERERADED